MLEVRLGLCKGITSEGPVSNSDGPVCSSEGPVSSSEGITSPALEPLPPPSVPCTYRDNLGWLPPLQQLPLAVDHGVVHVDKDVVPAHQVDQPDLVHLTDDVGPRVNQQHRGARLVGWQ